MNYRLQNAIAVCAVIVLLLLPLRSASGNAPPPPSAVWFIFDSHQSDMEGIQLIGCETVDCDNPVLLQQYGICNSPGCVASPPRLAEWSDTFECAADKCRLATYSNLFQGYSFKLIAQFSDATRESEALGKLPQRWAGEEAWRVTVHDHALSLSPEPGFTPPNVRYHLFLLGLVLTIVTESIVAAFYARVRLKATSSQLAANLLMVFLINLATFPVVWLFFPALGHFQSSRSRWTGILILAYACLYLVLLVFVYGSKDRSQRLRRILGSTVLLILALIFLLFVLFIFISRFDGIPAAGLSPTLVLISSELFAFLAEAFVLFLVGRGFFSKVHAAELSLLMNGASLLLGLSVFGF